MPPVDPAFARSTLAPDIRAAVERTTATNQHSASTTVMAATLSSARSPYPRPNSAPTSANGRLHPKPGTVLAQPRRCHCSPDVNDLEDGSGREYGKKESPERHPVVRGQPPLIQQLAQRITPKRTPILRCPVDALKDEARASLTSGRGTLDGTARRRTKRPPRRGQMREAAWAASFRAPRHLLRTTAGNVGDAALSAANQSWVPDGFPRCIGRDDAARMQGATMEQVLWPRPATTPPGRETLAMPPQ